MVKLGTLPTKSTELSTEKLTSKREASRISEELRL